MQGDWRDDLPERAPFDLVFADGGGAYGRVADLLAPGGILVKDDLTPGRPVAGDADARGAARRSAARGDRDTGDARDGVIVAVRRA